MAGLAGAVAWPLVARAQQTDSVWLNTPSLGFFSAPVNFQRAPIQNTHWPKAR